MSKQSYSCVRFYRQCKQTPCDGLEYSVQVDFGVPWFRNTLIALLLPIPNNIWPDVVWATCISGVKLWNKQGTFPQFSINATVEAFIFTNINVDCESTKNAKPIATERKEVKVKKRSKPYERKDELGWPRLRQRFLAKKYVAQQIFCSRVLLPHIKLVWYEGARSSGKSVARVCFTSQLPRVYRPLGPGQTRKVWRPNTITHCMFGEQTFCRLNTLIVWCCLTVFDRTKWCLVVFDNIWSSSNIRSKTQIISFVLVFDGRYLMRACVQRLLSGLNQLFDPCLIKHVLTVWPLSSTLACLVTKQCLMVFGRQTFIVCPDL